MSSELDSNSTAVANVHNNSTEFLIIVSQTVFFVLLFLILKSALVDRRGMMHSKQRIVEERLQLIAIFFAIFVVVGIIMIPLESYEYAHFVIPITYMLMLSIVAFEMYMVFYNGQNLEKTSSFTLPEVISVEKSPSLSVKSGRRPFSF